MWTFFIVDTNLHFLFWLSVGQTCGFRIWKICKGQVLNFPMQLSQIWNDLVRRTEKPVRRAERVALVWSFWRRRKRVWAIPALERQFFEWNGRSLDFFASFLYQDKKAVGVTGAKAPIKIICLYYFDNQLKYSSNESVGRFCRTRAIWVRQNKKPGIFANFRLS